MPQTVTGVAGSSIVAVTTSPSPAEPLSTTAQKASVQAVVNDLATIKSGSHTFAGDKTFTGATTMGDLSISQGNALVAAGTGCGLSGTWTVSGNIHFAQTRTLEGDGTGASITGQWHFPGGVTGFAFADAPSYLSDAAATLDTASAAQRFVMLTAPAANRVLTLRQSTAPIPPEGLWFEVTVMLGTSAFVVQLRREGSSDNVAVIGDGVGTSPFGSSNLVGTARVQVVAGVWRLVAVGGVAFYGVDA